MGKKKEVIEVKACRQKGRKEGSRNSKQKEVEKEEERKEEGNRNNWECRTEEKEKEGK